MGFINKRMYLENILFVIRYYFIISNLLIFIRLKSEAIY